MNSVRRSSSRRDADTAVVLAQLGKPKPSPRKKAKRTIHVSTADYWFSRCVRERTGWKCESCGGQYQEGDRGLHCSHFIGRANYSVRFDPLDADSHCFYCHTSFEGNPHKHTEWKKTQLGAVYEILIEKSNNVDLGKQARRSKSEIAAHYRSEFEKMKLKRSEGFTGRLEFTGWA